MAKYNRITKSEETKKKIIGLHEARKRYEKKLENRFMIIEPRLKEFFDILFSSNSDNELISELLKWYNTNEHYHKFEITEQNTTWNDLKDMYDKRVERYNVLMREYLDLLDSTKRNTLSYESQTMQYYLAIIRNIVLNCHKENELDIIRRTIREKKKYKSHSIDEKKEINKFKKWRKDNEEIYTDFFKAICLEEYKKGNIN